MDQKYRTRVAVLISLIVVAAVLGSFGRTIFSSRTPSVVLPTIHPDSSSIGGSDGPHSDTTPTVEVTVDTVQAVIASLDRSGSYYRQLSTQTFWPGGSGTTSVQVWVDDEYTYTRSVLPSGQVRFYLTAQDTVYYWFSGSSTWLTAPEDSLSPDLTQRIPTYEDVLALDTDAITDAGYGAYMDHPCIFVEAVQDELDYLERYWISVESGLLIGAETSKDGQIVYSVQASSPIQTPCPTDTVFALPDGTVLHSF